MDLLFSSSFLHEYTDNERIDFIYKNFKNDFFSIVNVIFKLYGDLQIKEGRRIPSNWFEVNEILNLNNEGLDVEFKNKLLLLKNRKNQYEFEDFQSYILLRQLRSVLITGLPNFIADYINFPIMSDFMYITAFIGNKNIVKWPDVINDIDKITTDDKLLFNYELFNRVKDFTIMEKLKFISKVVVKQQTPPLMLLKSLSFDKYCLNSLILLLTQNPIKGKETIEFLTKIFNRSFIELTNKKHKLSDSDLSSSKRYK